MTHILILTRDIKDWENRILNIEKDPKRTGRNPHEKIVLTKDYHITLLDSKWCSQYKGCLWDLIILDGVMGIADWHYFVTSGKPAAVKRTERGGLIDGNRIVDLEGMPIGYFQSREEN